MKGRSIRFLISIFLLSIYSDRLICQDIELIINEILASNTSTDYEAITNDYPDWIEIYNPDETSVEIGGFYLSTDPFNPGMWKIPEGTAIPANAYKTFWADGSDFSDHTNFSLDKESGYIGLYSGTGTLIDSFSYGMQLRDISYGRSPDDSLVYYLTPTRGKINAGVFHTSISPVPEVSLRGGFYSGSQTVEISCPDCSGFIFYTFDGSEPDTNSLHFSSPVVLNSTTALRTRVIRPGTLPGPVVTQTYLIDEPVNLPVISIVTDSANFFDDKKGIYITGTNGIRGSCDTTKRNLNQDWERPVNIELYEKDGTQAINQEAGIKIYGGCSRTRFPQKSLALYARKRYGRGTFDYQIFPDKNIFSFDTFILRSSADDQVRTFVRDALAQYAGQKEMDLDFQAYRPAVVFFDGQYWGIHDIREKINEHYIEDNFHLEKSTVNILQSNASLVYGDRDHYSSLMGFLSSASLEYKSNYDFVRSQIDIDQFIDYEILHIYLAERDWPGNNIKYWNSEVPGHHLWRWICFDLDQTFIRTSANTLEDATAINGPAWPNPPWSTLLLRRLLENIDFRSRFIQRYAFYLSTTFLPENLERTALEFKAVLEPEIPRHTLKWGGQMDPDANESWIPPTFSSAEEWSDNYDKLISFIHDRPSYAINHLKSKFGLKSPVKVRFRANIPEAGSVLLYDRHIPLPDFEGAMFPELPVVLKAVTNPGYRFLRWEITGNNKVIETAGEISFIPADNQVIMAVFEKTDDVGPVIIISEINYNSGIQNESGDWVELYNLQDSPVDLSGWKLRDSNPEHEYELPLNTVIGGHSYLVLCEDIEAFVSVNDHLVGCRGNTGFGFRNEGEVIGLYNKDNILVDSVRFDNKYPWPELPDGQGYSLYLLGTDMDNDNAESWSAHYKGTPGAPNNSVTSVDYPVNPADVMILNIYPNPAGFSSSVKYQVNFRSHVRICISDINGRIVRVPVNQEQNPGTYIIALDVNELTSGIYFCTMTADGKSAGSTRIVVMHR